GVRHHRRGLFVTHINTLHAETEAGAGCATGRPAHHEKDGVHALVFETLGDQLFSADGSHSFCTSRYRSPRPLWERDRVRGHPVEPRPRQPPILTFPHKGGREKFVTNYRVSRCCRRSTSSSPPGTKTSCARRCTCASAARCCRGGGSPKPK